MSFNTLCIRMQLSELHNNIVRKYGWSERGKRERKKVDRLHVEQDLLVIRSASESQLLHMTATGAAFCSLSLIYSHLIRAHSHVRISRCCFAVCACVMVIKRNVCSG